MTVARDLAEFLTGTSSADLPPQAVEHAAMLIASTSRAVRRATSSSVCWSFCTTRLGRASDHLPSARSGQRGLPAGGPAPAVPWRFLLKAGGEKVDKRAYLSR